MGMHAATVHGKGPVWTQIVRLSSTSSPAPSLATNAGGTWEWEEPFSTLKSTSSLLFPFSLQLQATRLWSVPLPSRSSPGRWVEPRMGTLGSPRCGGSHCPEAGWVQHHGQRPGLPCPALPCPQAAPALQHPGPGLGWAWLGTRTCSRDGTPCILQNPLCPRSRWADVSQDVEICLLGTVLQNSPWVCLSQPDNRLEKSRTSQCSALGQGESQCCHGLWRTKFDCIVFIFPGQGGDKSNIALGCLTQPGSGKGHIRKGSICTERTEGSSSLWACKMTFTGVAAHCDLGCENMGARARKRVCGCQGKSCPDRNKAEAPLSLPCQLRECCDPGLFETLLHWR